MKSVITCMALALALVTAPGCSDSREDLAGESLDVMTQVESVLATVKDADTAKAAKSKLEPLVTKMNDIKARMDKLGTPSEAEMKSMLDKYGTKMEELQKKMVGHMMRIGFDPQIQAELKDLDRIKM
jgi:hypothetical protein